MNGIPKILYLDQSRVSELVRVALGRDPAAGGTHRVAYQDLAQLLPVQIQAGKVICPFSIWHAVESVLFDDDDTRGGVCKFFDFASGRQAFRFFQDIFEEELAALGGFAAKGPLGDPLDCFPSGSIEQLTRDVLEGDQRPFTTVVNLLRNDPSLILSFVNGRREMLDALRGYVERYHQKNLPPSPFSLIREEIGTDILRTHLRNLIEMGLSIGDAESIHDRVIPGIRTGAWREAGTPNLGAWIDVFAARVHSGGKVDDTPKRRGDAFDLGHMAALGSSNMFLMERKYANLGQSAAKMANTLLLHSPGELVAELGDLP